MKEGKGREKKGRKRKEELREKVRPETTRISREETGCKSKE